MKDDIRKHLIDILHAAEEIETFIIGLDFTAYKKSQITQRAVERNFEIIGEALNRIRKCDEEYLENISEHYRIIGFRNILIHGYDNIDETIVWNAVKKHLPILYKEVKELLGA